MSLAAPIGGSGGDSPAACRAGHRPRALARERCQSWRPHGVDDLYRARLGQSFHWPVEADRRRRARVSRVGTPDEISAYLVVWPYEILSSSQCLIFPARTALVTGASGGLGSAIARALHRQGATVTLSGTRKEALADFGGRIQESAFTLVPCDLADPGPPWSELVPAAEAAMGGARCPR